MLSQVVPSFGLPFAFVPLAWFTSRRTIMGTFTNGAGMEAVTVIVVVAIVALDVLLGYLSIAG